jgi:hypothetical protein
MQSPPQFAPEAKRKRKRKRRRKRRRRRVVYQSYQSRRL